MNRVQINGTIGDLWRSKHYMNFRIFYANNQNTLCIELRGQVITNLRQMLYPIVSIEGRTKTDKETIAALKSKKISLTGVLKSEETRKENSAAIEESIYIQVDTLDIGEE